MDRSLLRQPQFPGGSLGGRGGRQGWGVLGGGLVYSQKKFGKGGGNGKIPGWQTLHSPRGRSKTPNPTASPYPSLPPLLPHPILFSAQAHHSHLLAHMRECRGCMVSACCEEERPPDVEQEFTLCLLLPLHNSVFFPQIVARGDSGVLPQCQGCAGWL